MNQSRFVSRALWRVILFALLAVPTGASTTAFAQSSFPNNLKTGLKTAIEEARSGSFIGSPSVEVRVEAGITYLRSEGYYGAQIDVVEPDSGTQIVAEDGFELEVPNDSRKLLVRTGSRFFITSADISLSAPDLVEARAARETITNDLRTLNQKPARSGDVVRVQSQTLVSLKEAGFTQAQDTYPDIVVDHATTGMSIAYAANTGPLTQLGAVSVIGADLTPAPWVIRTAAVRAGSVATGERLRQIAERFRLTGAYQTVQLELAQPIATSPDIAIADIVLTLEERTKRIWSAGAAWSTSDGLGVDASTSYFHRLGRADTLTLDGRLGTLDTSVGANLRLPSFRGSGRDILLNARAGQQTTDAFTRLLARLSANYVSQRGRKDFLTYGVGLDFTRTRTPADDLLGLTRRDVNGADLSLLMRYERDRSDDLLNPTKGWRASGDLQPAIFFGEDQTIPYGRVVIAGSYYQPFSGLRGGVIAARGKAGILITENERLPFDRRFFAGGGGSVRGYAFQSIGPRDINDNPLGGQSVIEAALEARWSLRGPLGMAVFVDAARVGTFDTLDEQQTRVGVGVGVRYNLGLAPLRFDIGVPLNKRKGDPPVQLYISAGQAF